MKRKNLKSISEKAVEYGLLNPDIHYDNEGNSYDNHDKPAEDFVAGANYVLEQVENLLKDKNTGLVETWDKLMTLSEELNKN